MADLGAILEAYDIDASSLQCLNGSDNAESLYYFPVRGTDAVAHWHRLRAVVLETAHWPVLLGTDKDIELHTRAVADRRFRPVQELIQAAERIGVHGLLDHMADLSGLQEQIAYELLCEEDREEADDDELSEMIE